MLFITNPHLRKLEAFMQEVPNFPPKGAKIDFDRLEDELLLFEIESVIVNVKPPNENLNIRKDNIMKIRNEKHRSTFLNEAKKQSLKNYRIITALYLLTADEKLWDTAKSFVGKDEIVFENIWLKSSSEKTANFLYPNIEYCYAAGMSFVTTDSKADLYRNTATIAEKYYGYKVSVIDLRNTDRS